MVERTRFQQAHHLQPAQGFAEEGKLFLAQLVRMAR